MTRHSGLEERVEAERQAHETDDVLAESYRLKDKFSHIWSYPSLMEMEQLFDKYTADVSGKVVLDYGCGNGQASLDYLKKGAHVYGIDISEPYIQHCILSAQKAGVGEDRFDFQVMDAHKLSFQDNMFDLVAGNGILHHLDPLIAMSEIYRVLKPGGRVLLKEPLAGNPLLRAFRVLTPAARTEDEKPLDTGTIKQVTLAHDWESESFYCGVVEAAAAVLTSVLMPRKPDNKILSAAHCLEKGLRKRSLLISWNQYILLCLVKKA